jgi:predicted transcriptional regulator
MNPSDTNEELLDFFKALADANRLKIVGLLAQQPLTVERLAAQLGLATSTTSHHLQMLAHVGLVSARPIGHYYEYSLQTDVLQKLAKRLLSRETLPHLSEAIDVDAYDRKVLEAFTRPDGSIITFPSQEKKFLVLLRHVLKAFEPGKRYTEKQVNEILSRYHEDTASLRRGLIEYSFMDRVDGGSEYWRLETS